MNAGVLNFKWICDVIVLVVIDKNRGHYAHISKAGVTFCREMIPTCIFLADGLYSNILTENGKDTEVFVLDVTDFRSAAAKEVYNWCTCGNAEKEHKWLFLR